MPQFIATRVALLLAVSMFVGFSSLSHAQESDAAKAEKAELEEKLAEAQRLLEEDKMSHKETAEKKRLIDEKLAARQQREDELQEELETLCKEQEELKPGTLDGCMAKLFN